MWDWECGTLLVSYVHHTVPVPSANGISNKAANSIPHQSPHAFTISDPSANAVSNKAADSIPDHNSDTFTYTATDLDGVCMYKPGELVSLFYDMQLSTAAGTLFFTDYAFTVNACSCRP